MLFKLIILFTVVPLVELALLLKLGAETEWWIPVVIVIVTGIIGGILARSQGTGVMRKISAETRAGLMPGDALLDGMFVLVGGAFLVTPGIITDAVGFACLIPPSRELLKKWIKRWFRRQIDRGRFIVHGFYQRPEEPRRDDDWLEG